MKKILSVLVLSIAMYIPLTLNAALAIPMGPVYTGGGPTSSSKTTQINQVNLEAQKIAAEKALQEEQQRQKAIADQKEVERIAAIQLENENQQKIKELEERINELESKQTAVDKVITPTKEVVIPRHKEEIIKPTVSGNLIIKQKEPKKEIIEKKSSTIIESPNITETPATPIKESLFHRVLHWFKGLI